MLSEYSSKLQTLQDTNHKQITDLANDMKSEFSNLPQDIQEEIVNDTFMKYKQEASGCKCDPKYCKNDCKNDKECKTKIQYIIDNTAYDLDIDKVKYNSGLRFIAKICLNNLWGHFAHARLKLYELLDILQERVLYMDTDSCIYNDDGSEACKKIESMMGNKLEI
ncbi:unnamed protein product [Mytilus coruscus]|uniref:DNA-directed DNA polymerase n=1 Tax=Mytilus coruscus TaxID=42192 RepID=A0A6J8C143_MYTCO|nr:unnamed protein product [Mytilus coruscus]